MDDDDLYKVPLAEFTATRDAIAARLKAAGDKDGAAGVKRAKKPSIAAWAANQVVWHAPDDWQKLEHAATALRRAHQKAASPDDVRQATREQRDALAACEARAAGMLVQNGHAATPVLVEKVGHSLLALAYGSSDATAGRLETDLPPPGFDALAGLTLAAPKPRAVPAPPAKPAPERPAAAPASRQGDRRAEAEEKRRAEEQRRRAEDERARHRAAVKAAEARQAESRRALTKARATLETAQERFRALEAQLETVRQAAAEAQRQLAAAEAEDEAAAAALDSLRAEASA